MSLLFTLAALALYCMQTFFSAQLNLPANISAQLPLVTVVLLALAVVLQLFSVLRKKPATEPPPAVVSAPAEVAPQPSADALAEAQVVQFLARLQEKARLVDFAMDDITPHSNEDIGAAARIVHQGCQEVLGDIFDLKVVHPGEEGESLRLSADFDRRAYRLVGKVPENPPFNGRVLHRGWKTEKIKLPQLTDAGRDIVAPAEVEID